MTSSAALKVSSVINVHEVRNHCASCGLHELCLPTGLADEDMLQFDRIVGRRRVAKGEFLHRLHDPLNRLYAIRLGHFKTHRLSTAGKDQITGFQMAGELLGMDAIGTERHNCDATALEDSDVCDIPFAELESLLGAIPILLHRFHRLMSQEIIREQSVMLLLGNMRAEQRMTVFLINLSGRYAARGYSSTRFQLRMSREEIGSYLGLTIESISRLLSRFKKKGLLKIENREIELLDHAALTRLAGGNYN